MKDVDRWFAIILSLVIFTTMSAMHAFSTEDQGPKPLTLAEAYKMALKRSETVAISAEGIQQARARFYRSFDYFLPKVNYLMSRTQRDISGDGGSASGVGGDFRRGVTPEAKFTFSQPIFSGFKEIAALQGAGADKKQQILNWRRAKELLFVDVMNAYYAILQAQENVETLQAVNQLGQSRLGELEERIRVGRSRNTEKQTALADLKLVQSDLIEAESVLVVSKRLLEFYIGEPLAGFVLVDEELPRMSFDALDFEERAEARSDVQALGQGYILAKKLVMIARGNLFPTVSASGNYYTRRVGFLADVDWDVTLQVNVPVLELGKNLGEIKAAASAREAKRLAWREAARMAQLDIENAFEDLQAAQSSEKALGDARAASKENYHEVAKDYQFNLVSNLEVLDSLRRLQDIELRYNEAYYRMKKSYWKFKVALGKVLDEVEG